MCGIAGHCGIAPIKPEEAASLCERMGRVLANRGPDGAGIYHDSDLLLIHRRLAIIDLSENGAQPLWNEDHTICIVVNGEIYNFQELRRDLEIRGHRFRSRSDSEVILHLYEEKGIGECCAALQGMFAFALWDSRSRELFLVRDRLGIKPLAVAEHAGGVTFGSTLKAVLSDPAVPRDLRPEAHVALLKWGFVPSPWSIVRAVRRVMPGTWLRIHNGRIEEERRWWTDRPVESAANKADVRDAIEQAIASHLVADVPVGVLLSAGIDSGLVTALSARSYKGHQLEAWTVSHPNLPEDEYAEAAAAAAHFGVKLHEVAIGGSGLTEENFDDVIAVMDEPLAAPSLFMLHRLFKALSPKRRVVLSGDGGDELFGGYDWHVGMPALPEWAQTNLFRKAAPGLSRLAVAGGRVGAVGRVARQMLRHPASIYLDKLRVASDEELLGYGLNLDFDDPIEASAISAWERFAGTSVLEQMLAVDRATALVDEMLAKVDTMSMAHSVESRVPLLADAVVEAAKGLAGEEKRRGGVGKICLREWYGELAPHGASARPKTGFNAPLTQWHHQKSSTDFLHERARNGFASLSAPVATARPRVSFISAVLDSWVKRHPHQAQT
ncbi:MAG: asparagine synthase (glutamine-hydrolyzing) [Pyrinomonadaceae bacterium]